MLKHTGMPRASKWQNQSGFTLVELMVTIVIFSFVMVMLFSSFNAFLSTGQSIAGGIDYNQRARDALNRMCEDLDTIYTASFRELSVQDDLSDDLNPFQMSGTEDSVGGKQFASVVFTTLAGLETGRSKPAGVVRVTYYVRQNSRNGFDLCRAERFIGSDREKDPCTDPVLAEDITGFSLGFVGADLTETEQWGADDTDKNLSAPAAVNIRLTLNSGGKEKTFETSVCLPVKGEAGE